MEALIIQGGRPLHGCIPINGAKNAALPLMAASLLTQDTLTLHHIPMLEDVRTLKALLVHHGVSITHLKGSTSWILQGKSIQSTYAPYEIVSRMRASFLVLGPLLAREGEAKVALPGGCAWGPRPVDFHLHGLKAMGADIHLEGGYIHARAPLSGLSGGHYHFPRISVTGSMNLVMAACLGKGHTHLTNVAIEPEVTNLVYALRQMGARIQGEGTGTLDIQGTTSLEGADITVIPDRLEIGTYLACVGATGGSLTMAPVEPEVIQGIINPLSAMGLCVEFPQENTLKVTQSSPLEAVSFETMPYPGFPTDLQAPFMVLLSLARGISTLTESIYENRFMHVPELQRMGADIVVHGNTATITGVEALEGAHVEARDLRAGASLVVAGLAAKGITTIRGIFHLDRGYADLVKKLRACGASILRVAE